MDTLTLKSLEEFSEYFYVRTNSENWRENEGFYQNLIGIVPSLLSLARRQLEHPLEGPEGVRPPAPACALPVHSDVPPLGRISKSGALVFKDEDGDECMFWTDEKGFGVSSSENGIFFRKDQIPSLLAHLQSWLDTGSFELKPRAVESDVSTPATDQSTEGKTDTKRMDWLEKQGGIGVDENRNGEYNYYTGGTNFPSLREVVDKAMAEERGAA